MQMLLPMLKKYLVPLVTVFTISFSIAVAQAPFITSPEPKIAPTRNDIQLAVAKYAFIYNVPQETLFRVIFCESSFNVKAIGDGGYSRGLVQIHSKYHPHVTDDMAFDVEYAVRFLAKNISEGRGDMWTCFRKL